MNKKSALIIVLLVIIFATIACGSSTPTVSTSIPSSEEREEVQIVESEQIIEPTKEIIDTPMPKPTATVPSGTRRDNPAPLGSIVTLDDVEISINSITRPADSIVKAGNMFNTEPETGQEYLFVEVSIKCLESMSETCSISTFDFSMVGSLGIGYDAEWFLSGVEGLIEDTDIYGGSTVTGNVVYIVGIGETDLLLIYEPLFGFTDPVYLAIN